MPVQNHSPETKILLYFGKRSSIGTAHFGHKNVGSNMGLFHSNIASSLGFASTWDLLGVSAMSHNSLSFNKLGASVIALN